MGLAIYYILSDLSQLYWYMMLAWIILSWLPNLQYNRYVMVLGKLVEPYLSIFRRIVPTLGGIDFSPIVAFFVFRIITGIIFGQLLPILLHV